MQTTKDCNTADIYVGAKIKEARLFRHMGQDVLADKLGLSFQQIQKYELGQNRVTCGRLYEIAVILGVKVEWFFEGLEDIDQGELPPPLDTQQRRLVELLDRVPDMRLRAAIVEFLAQVATGIVRAAA